MMMMMNQMILMKMKNMSGFSGLSICLKIIVLCLLSLNSAHTPVKL